MSVTEGKPIFCKAAVAWEPKKSLSIETVEVAPPKAGEVRIKILASGVCRTDAHSIDGINPLMGSFPAILGHEGAGVVESVGEGVTSFKPGDNVIPLYNPQCRECPLCKSSKTNLCVKIGALNGKSVMDDGTSRFTCNGKTIGHFMDTSTFSEYTVVPERSLAKIDDKAPLDKVCLLGCGIPTGYGAARNTAKVEPGSSCAVWGLGAVGLAAIMGCKAAGASRIIALDINPNKFPLAKQFGATECINPTDHEKPIQNVLREMTRGGLDYTFECIGNVKVMKSALEACHMAWGVCTIVGVAPIGHEVAVNSNEMLTGRVLKGTVFGGYLRDEIPGLCLEYTSGKLKLDEFITHNMDLKDINSAFELLNSGKSIRTVINLNH